MPLIMSQKLSDISFNIYVNAAQHFSQVKWRKLKTSNKDAITKEISCIELILSHQNLYSRGIQVKRFLIGNTFQAVKEDSVIM